MLGFTVECSDLGNLGFVGSVQPRTLMLCRV